MTTPLTSTTASRLGPLSAHLHPTSQGPIEAAVCGSGPALLVIHGSGGDWRQSIPFAEDLGERNTVILISRPGYGASPLATGASLEEQARAYAGLLQTLGVGRAAVLGMSGGGPAALAFAAYQGGACRGLILCCAAAPHLVAPTALIRLAAVPGVVALFLAMQRRTMRRALTDPAAQARLLDQMLTATEKTAIAGDGERAAGVREYLRRIIEPPPVGAGLVNDTRMVRGGLRIPQALAAKVAAPALVMHGDADTVVPFSHAEHYAGVIPGAELDRWPGAGHLFLLAFRPETSARVAGFLDGLGAA